ncbi:MAG: hypothetical protein JNK67_23865 [Alphaproteobacteria bacterium]|nr:hypothetical protein [Alphaproteobacteria bacterium]
MIRRSTLLRRLAALPLASLAPSSARAQGPVPVSGEAFAAWFAVEGVASRSWRLVADAGDPMRVDIRRIGATGPATHRVLVLYPRESSAYVTAMTRILEIFGDKRLDVAFNAVNFDRDDARGIAALRRAETDGTGLIFAMGSESTAWLHEKYLDGRLPVVSVCSKDPVILGQARDYESGSGSNFAFTSLNVPLDLQMTYVHKIKPQLRNIGILVDATNVSAVETQAEPVARYAERRGIRSLMLKVADPRAARAELSTLVAGAVGAMRRNDPGLDRSVLWITGSTAVFREIRTINAHADRVPVLSVVPEVVQAGDDSAVLSIGVSFESNAHLAAIYGADVLTGGVPAGSLPVGLVSPPDIAINFRKAREIGLRIPFRFFESAGTVYDYEGNRVRSADMARPG